MKRFREAMGSLDQMFLLPLSVDQFVKRDSPARVLAEIIKSIDTSRLYARYEGGGAPAYDPAMMLRVLVFAYAEGIRSSRKIATALEQDIRFMFLAEMSKPSFRTIARFREENIEAISELFLQTVMTCQELGLVLLDHVSVDGTKIEANVSGKETYGAGRLDKAIADMEKKIADILREAGKADELEDVEYGERRGDEIPEGLRDAEARKEHLEKAKKKLGEIGRKSIGTTDLDGRVMKTKAGIKPAYNGQAVVDGKAQVIVAASVTQDENDYAQLVRMLDQTEENTGSKPEKASADSGYYSSDNLTRMEDRGIDAYIPDDGHKQENKQRNLEYDAENDCYKCPMGKVLKFAKERAIKGLTYRVYRCCRCTGCAMAAECKGQTKHPIKELYVRVGGEAEDRMRAKMSSKEGKAIYRLRKQIVEPVFGNIKWNMGMRRLLLRGLKGASIEYYLACICHNMGKIRAVWGQRAQLATC